MTPAVSHDSHGDIVHGFAEFGGQMIVVAAAALAATIAFADPTTSWGADGTGADFVSVETLTPFAFDTPDGNHRTRRVPIDCHVNAIRARMHFSRFGRDTTESVPSMTISIESASKRVTLALFPIGFRPPLYMMVQVSKAGQVEYRSVVSNITIKNPVTVVSSWTPDGRITFHVGHQMRAASADGPIVKATIRGSTGAGSYDPLELGTVGKVVATGAPVTPCEPVLNL